ncbi:non-ribosomal peptide synthetase [Salinispora pacifica]|uniref:non-ribosomal peptide synthetase n=1 Tax=Salinispora pacifica TaxID=351187 RepID=UPI0003618E80|nr:non-ribosomal peptide synthetase [Salinispora pacifica]
MPDHRLLPLSPAQAVVWHAYLGDPGARHFVMAGYLDIDGGLDPDAFRAAWRRLRAEAEVMRVTTVEEHDDRLWQVVAEDPGVDLPLLDLTGGPDPDAAARAWMAADAAEPTTVEGTVLAAWALIRTGEDRYLYYQRFHHVLLDGFGIAQLTRRLSALYAAESAGAPAGPARFGCLADVLAEDTAYRESAGFAADRAYWQERFADRPAPTRLAPPPAPGHRGTGRVRVTGTVPAAEVARLDAAAAAAGADSVAVVITAAVAYLHRATGDTDVIVALPLIARTTAAARRTPCMVANTLPLRLRVRPGDSLLSLAPQVSRRLREMVRHQHYRHEDLHRDLGLDARRGGLLGAMVNVMSFEERVELGGRDVPVHTVASPSALDVSIEVRRGAPGGGTAILLDANPHAYDLSTLRDHLDRFLRLLSALAAAPDAALSSFDLLSGAERRILLAEENATAAPLPRPATVPRLFEARAAATPDAPAVTGDDGTLTYAELNARANRLARHLLSLGVGPESFVALGLPQGTGYLVAMLAVLKAGAAYLPVDLAYPARRLAYILGDAAPQCALTDSATALRLPGGGRTVVLDEPVVAAAIARQHPTDVTDAERTVPIDPAHCAYTIYTSGSTGLPKGALLTHAGLVNVALDHVDRMAIGPGDRFLQFVSPSFDVAALDIWCTLLSGACLVLMPAERLAVGEDLVAYARRHRITHSVWPAVVATALGRADLPTLRTLVTGGDPVDAPTVAWWSADRRMIHGYGVTEASIVSTATDPIRAAVSPPIGRPIRNTQVYVLDDSLQPVPPGTVGELYLAGVGLARGYRGLAGLTAERFLPCPFGTPGQRMYRSGDLVRRLADGNLEFLGRADQQAKIRGVRMELGEIQQVLARDRSVGTVVAVVREDEPGEKRLVAYVVPAPGADVDPLALRRAAGDWLPPAMVPSAVVVLPELPLGVHGKLDRAALPAPDLAATAGDRAAASAAERTLCQVYAEVLGLPRVGADDRFFDLGGNSIMVTRLVTRAREAGLEISAHDVFTELSPAGLAAVASPVSAVALPEVTADVNVPAEILADLRRRYPGLERVLPVSPLQTGFLLHSVLAGDADIYHAQLVLDLEGPLDTARLGRALTTVLERHAALRTGFLLDELAEPVQVVVRTPEVAPLDTGAEGDVRRGFDLAQPPLLRMSVLPLGAGAHRVVLTGHHIVVDAWSTAIVVGELFDAYDGTALAPAPDYGGYLAWLGAQDRDRAGKAWHQALDGLTGPTLAAPWVAVEATAPQRRVVRKLTTAETGRVTAALRRHGLTLHTVVEGLWARTLAELTGSWDVVFGTSVSGRDPRVPGVETMVGLLTNTVPVRVNLRSGEPVLDLLRRIQREQAELLPYQYLGLADIQRACGLRDLFDTTTLTLDHDVTAADVDARVRDLTVRAVTADEGTQYPLRFAAVPGKELRLMLNYRTDAFTEAEATRLLETAHTRLRELADDAAMAAAATGRQGNPA